jgi:uncharacterized protein (TIGR03435 family)
MVKIIVSIATVALIAIGVHAQAPQPPGTAPAFEVVSVKRRTSDAPGSVSTMLMPGGRVVAQNVTVRDLIRSAYALEDSQVEGGPGWIRSDRFDIEARAGETATSENARAMLRSLLTERFRLESHIESKETSIFALVTARGDGKLGSGLRRSSAECAPITPPPGAPAPPPPPPAAGLALGGYGFRCPSAFLPGRFSLRAIDMHGFSIVLWRRGNVGRPVANRTGLTGEFDIDLFYAPYGESLNGSPLATEGLPSIFTALQEQLGLRLDSARGPLDVLVIDRISPPAEN